MTVLEEALELLACPRGCAGRLHLEAQALVCPACDQRYPRRGIHGDVVDFVPELVSSTGRSQRVMENPFIARIYEDHWRPWFTALGGSFDYAQEETWLLAQHAGSHPQHVLDLACGSGRYARLFDKQLAPQLVFAVDLSLPMLEVAAARAASEGCQRIVFVRADASHLPLRDASIDLLNCFGALHLFPHPERALQQLGRVARPSAVFTCLTAAKRDELGAALLQQTFSRAATFRFFSDAELRSALDHAGFEGYQPEQHGSLLLFRAERRAPIDAPADALVSQYL